jgi:hypothetical protein
LMGGGASKNTVWLSYTDCLIIAEIWNKLFLLAST